MKQSPKISIVIPVYNGSNYLKEAIDSALAQTYSNIEIVVVNDGSTDDGATRDIALSYGEKINYYEKENGGAASALNYGIDKMTGDYFSWLSHDDIYLPEKISKEVKILQKHKKEDVVIACNVNVVNENLSSIKENKISDIFNKSVQVFLGMDTKTGLNGCSLLIPKSLFDKVGKFDTELRYTQDYDMWYKLSKIAKFYLVNDNLVLSRQHSMQDSVIKTEGCTMESDILHYRIINDLNNKDLVDAFDKDIDEILKIADIYYISGYYKTSAIILVKILEFYKNDKDYKNFNVLFKNKILNNKFDVDFNKSSFFSNEKSTIMFYSNVWVKGGIERVLSLISGELVDKYNIVLVSGQGEDKNGYALNEKIKHIYVDNAEDNLQYSLLVLSLLYNADVFVGNPNIINSFLDIYTLLKDTNVKTIAYNHYYYFLPYYASWIYPIAKKRKDVYGDVDACVWLTEHNTKIHNLFHENGLTIPNPSLFDIQKPGVKKGKVILSVGRFYDSIKRIDRVLKTFRLILDKDQDVKLVLVGDYKLDMKIPSDGDTIGELIEKLNFPEGAITWVGEQENVGPYYKDASVLMVTSENEGFSLVTLEAITHGLPCTMFEIPGIDLVQDGSNGYVVPQDDFKGLAKYTLEILNNKDLYKRMSDKSLEIADKYKLTDVLKLWDELFNVLIQNKTKLEIREDIKKKYVKRTLYNYDFVKEVALGYEKSLEMVIEEYNKKQASTHTVNQYNVAEVDKNTWFRVKRWGRTIISSIKRDGYKKTFAKVVNRVESKFKK